MHALLRSTVRALAATIVLALVPATAIHGQVLPTSIAPATNDSVGAMPHPLMLRDVRLQQFYAAAECGTTGTFVVGSVAFRYDGPSAGARAASHSVDRLRLRIGTTRRDIPAIGASFEANLTDPLHTIADVRDWRFTSDATPDAVGPQAFGGVGGELRFAVVPPLVLTVPPTGCLVLELRIEGNHNADVGDVAMLDGHAEFPAGGMPGWDFDHGGGCAIHTGGHEARCEVAGQFDIGTAFTTYGSGYAPGAPVATLLTFEFMLPYLRTTPLDGVTPRCTLAVDPVTGPLVAARIADANGELAPYVPGSSVPIPPLPELCGDLLYVQNLSPMPSGAGVQTSNYRTIAVGCPPPPVVPVRQVVHHQNADADVASVVFAGGLALELR